MKKFPLIVASVLLFTMASFSQATCTRHNEPTGNFSYCPPTGWTPRDPKSGTFKSFVTPEGAASRANFNLKTEATAVSHEAYMVAALRMLMDGNEAKGDGATKMIGWTKFATDSKLQGSRVVYETLYEGIAIRTIQYVLDLPAKKLILTGTSLQQSKSDGIFDAVARSIRVER